MRAISLTISSLLIFSPMVTASADFSIYKAEDFYNIAGVSIGDDCDQVLANMEIKESGDTRFEFRIPGAKRKNMASWRIKCDENDWTVTEVYFGDTVAFSNPDWDEYLGYKATDLQLNSSVLALDKKFKLFQQRVRPHQFNKVLKINFDDKDTSHDHYTTYEWIIEDKGLRLDLDVVDKKLSSIRLRKR